MRTALLSVLVAALSLASPAAFARMTSADSNRALLTECSSPASPDDALRACELLVRSRRYSGHLLSMVYNNLGAAHANLNNIENAIEAYSLAIKNDPRYILPRANRAKNLAILARYPDAIEDMDAAIKISPTADNYSLRAYFRESNNDLPGALADYSEAVKMQPKVAQYYRNRGDIFAKLSQHADAIEDYSRAIQLNPRDPNLYFARGLSWANAGKCDQAVPDYTKAIELSPRFATAYNNRGVCNARAGKRDEAIADYEASLKWDPGNERARSNLSAIKNMTVPRAAPVIVEVPKFEVPPVKEIFKTPEFSLDQPTIAPAAEEEKK